jgi:hypothetical protein
MAFALALPSQASDRHVCFSLDDQAAARYALDAISKTTNNVPDLKWQRDGDGVRYTFLDAWWKEKNNPPLYLAIHGITDDDACIQGYARHIEFYSEHGTRLGYAEPGHGVNFYPKGWRWLISQCLTG